eukprot:GHVR01009985.1.p1 GENE.GHVR01009985.1~~GHVR01009985.1.p1  ORF type:complete len:586 (+),score=143.42 GHVR01009985.1:71-1828(+)
MLVDSHPLDGGMDIGMERGMDTGIDGDNYPGCIDQEDSWEVISSYFREKGLVHQQIGSFNDFMYHKMQEIVDQHPPIDIIQQPQYDTKNISTGRLRMKYSFKFGQLALNKPSGKGHDGVVEFLFPHEARLRNLTYAAPLYVDIERRVCGVDDDENEIENEEGEDTVVYSKVPLGRVPVMVKSHFCWLDGWDAEKLAKLNECSFDQGGYFIVNGSEKVLVAQERMANNFIHLFKKKGDSQIDWVCDIRSMQEGRQATTPFSVKLKKRRKGGQGGKSNYGQIVATLPYIRKDIPIVILFRALGVVSDRDIMARCSCENMNDKAVLNVLKASIEEAFDFHTQDVCLDFIARRGATVGSQRERRLQFARDRLTRDVLPHIGVTEDCNSRKAYFVGYIVYRLCLGLLGRLGNDDRDHLGKKRIDTAGALMAASFGQLFRKLCKDVRRTLQKSIDQNKPFDLAQTVSSSSGLTQGLTYQLATGNWVKDKMGQVIRTGVSQVLNRLTFAAGSSHLRRLNTPLGRDGKLAKPRQLHNTHWGYVCPAETPEGQQVGLVKNLALLAHVTVGCPCEPLHDTHTHKWRVPQIQEAIV